MQALFRLLYEAFNLLFFDFFSAPFSFWLQKLCVCEWVGATLLGTLSNYDDDHNDDFKKTVGLMIKTTALHVHHAF